MVQYSLSGSYRLDSHQCKDGGYGIQQRTVSRRETSEVREIITNAFEGSQLRPMLLTYHAIRLLASTTSCNLNLNCFCKLVEASQPGVSSDEKTEAVCVYIFQKILP